VLHSSHSRSSSSSSSHTSSSSTCSPSPSSSRSSKPSSSSPRARSSSCSRSSSSRDQSARHLWRHPCRACSPWQRHRPPHRPHRRLHRPRSGKQHRCAPRISSMFCWCCALSELRAVLGGHWSGCCDCSHISVHYIQFRNNCVNWAVNICHRRGLKQTSACLHAGIAANSAARSWAAAGSRFHTNTTGPGSRAGGSSSSLLFGLWSVTHDSRQFVSRWQGSLLFRTLVDNRCLVHRGHFYVGAARLSKLFAERCSRGGALGLTAGRA
jgi:hypothetical protein